MGFAGRLALAAAVVGAVACGGGGGGAASCDPGPTASMSITAAGTSPTNVCVAPSGVVTFTNNDTAPHHLVFDATTSCPAIPEIAPGTSQQVTFPNTFNCTYHDVDNAAAAFTGTVAVTSVVVSGGGY